MLCCALLYCLTDFSVMTVVIRKAVFCTVCWAIARLPGGKTGTCVRANTFVVCVCVLVFGSGVLEFAEVYK